MGWKTARGRPQTKLRTPLAVLPVVVLAAAYTIICLHFRSPWPFGLVVHEDGRHTLLGTIFYFEHAAGELAAQLVLSAAIAGAMLHCAGACARGLGCGPGLAATALAIDSVIVLGAIASVGVQTTLSWLLQYHTRDGSPAEFGSHWRYHFLSEACLILLAMSLAAAVGRCRGSGRLLQAAWVTFAVLSVAFGIAAAPFADARYLGHEARETFTHALTTVPLAIGICCFCADGGPSGRVHRCRIVWPAAACALLAVYQVAGAVFGGVREHAQSADPVRLVCAHFFEHTFSLLVVGSHSALLYVLASGRGAANSSARGGALRAPTQ